MAAIEMAFVFPVMLILYFGLVDVTNLLAANRKVTLTASTIGDLVAQAPGSMTMDDMDTFLNAASPIMEPFVVDLQSGSDFGYVVWEVGRDSDNNLETKWTVSKDGAGCSQNYGGNLEDLTADGNDVVIARVCYNWKPIVGKVIGSGSIQLEETLTLRPRQAATITCDDCPS